MNEIKHQLIAKIGDTSDRATRVQQHVNLKKNQHFKMKKVQWGYYATIVAFIGVLVLCINLIPSALNEEVGQLTGPEPTETLFPPIEEDDDKVSVPNEDGEDEVVPEKGDYFELLKQYFAPDGSEAVFTGGYGNGGVKTQTFWLSDHYVQQVISNDEGIVERVYRLNGNQIESVYVGMIDESDRTQWSIEQLNKLSILEIILKAPFEIGDEPGDWKVIETSGQVTTTYESFSNVLVVENAYDDVRMRKYYVQGLGEVKWETAYLNKESGEYERFMTTDLASVTPAPAEVEKPPSRFDAQIDTNYEATYHSGWKTSPDGLQQATIDGKGEKVLEEGEALLVIQNLKTSESMIYQLKENDQGQYTPKYVEWIDENRLFVIIGYAHGTITRGGMLYMLNIKDNIVTPVIEDLNLREEIMSIKANEDGTFSYKKHVYDNDNYNYNESHIEEGTLPIPTNN
ncbi:DUF4652 domain-containing protein [Paenisporosarcina indica]|uniref:DUF4652 domain-containing protein n=1 Tax=Paenisporosarcina indica TaxID=650093 RepID=UPI00094FCBF9|nr:DUF4652 domain-containing protein [Paenisporosarcina indica]